MATITFIEHPRFTVDFRQFSKRGVQLMEAEVSGVTAAAFAALKLVNIVFDSMGKAVYVTFSYSWISFKQIVLGYYGSFANFRLRTDLYFVVFKIAFWIAALGWNFAATTFRLAYEQLHDKVAEQSLLSRYAGLEMDTSHIRTNDLGIDVSHVPAAVTVSSLLGMLDNVNFEHPDQPGYMPPLSRTEGRVPYTIDELRQALQRFVDHVNGRVAFLGTPPAHDTPRLMAFYEQIENAVRFSIHKVQQDLREFQAVNGVDVAAYTAEQRRKYNDLLENIARVPLNLAFAGKHCGARFMGESMELYDAYRPDASIAGGTLEDAIVELLAAKRMEIAKAHVQAYLGADTHSYNKYMQNMGPLLGLPGTKNIIEHLSRDFDQDQYLRLFFVAYTVDLIIATIQEKAQKSQVFREKLFGWLQDSGIGDWSAQVNEELLSKMLEEAAVILAQNALAADNAPLANLQTMVEELDLPQEENSTEWVQALFALPAAIAWRQVNIPGNALAKATAKTQMMALFGKDQLGDALIEAIKQKKPLAATFAPRLLEQQKTEAIRRLTGIDSDVALRVVKGETDLKEAILAQKDIARRAGFLPALQDGGKMGLKPEEVEEEEEGPPKLEPLKPEMMEWLLVSQKILVGQV